MPRHTSHGHATGLTHFPAPRSHIFFRVPKLCTDLDGLHFGIKNKQQIHTEKSNASARYLPPAQNHERCPHVCRVKVTCTLLPTNSFIFTTTNSKKCLVNWIPLRIRIRLRNAQPNHEYVFDLQFFTIFIFFVGLPNIVSLRLLPIACFYTWTPNLTCRLGCWQWVDDVLSFASSSRYLYQAPFTVSSVGVCLSSLLLLSRFSSKIKSVITGARWYATKWSRVLWLLAKSTALSSCSTPPVGLKGTLICSDTSHIHVDSSANSALKVIASLTISILTKVSLPYLLSNLPAHLGVALVKVMPTSGCCGFWFVVQPPPLHTKHLPPRPCCNLRKSLSNSLTTPHCAHCLHLARTLPPSCTLKSWLVLPTPPRAWQE